MKRLSTISLKEVLRIYFSYSEDDFVQQGKNSWHTRCPLHNERKGTSFVLYDKPEGWDWYCFGACGRGGNAVTLLTAANLFPTPESAADDLRRVFKLELPSHVTLANFAEYKGIPESLLVNRGITEVDRGLSIPFYGADKQVVATKCRLSFTDSPRYIFTHGSNTLYGLDLLDGYDRNEVLFTTEGESDALTAMAAGLQVVGIPGVNAWKPEFADALDHFATICHIPDNDAAGMSLLAHLADCFPTKLRALILPRGYSDLSEWFMYGLQANTDDLYSYCTTYQLLPATPQVFIDECATTPKIIANEQAWRVILSQMPSEAEQLLYLDELSKEAGIGKRIVNKAYSVAKGKVAAKEEEDPTGVLVENGAYWKWVSTANGAQKVRLTNFTIKLNYTLRREGVHTRCLTLIGEDGRQSQPITLDGDALTVPLRFAAACKDAGSFLFEGGFSDLAALNKVIFAQDERIVHSPTYIGRTKNGWLLGNVGVSNRGQTGSLTRDGLLHLGEHAYRQDTMDERPQLPVSEAISDTYKRRLLRTFHENIGGMHAWLALGWAVAGWNSNEVFLQDGEYSYPLLFIVGKRNSGKTYLARWLMQMYGMNPTENHLESPTLVSISNKLAYYASLPVWYDDYKNTIRDIGTRAVRLLGAYNRQGRTRGTQHGGNESIPVRSFVLLSGEDTPNDNALLSRCAVIQVSQYDRDDSLIRDMLDLSERFGELGLHFCKQSLDPEPLLEHLAFVMDYLTGEGVDSRVARCYAVPAAGFFRGYGDVLTVQERNNFLRWLTSHAKQSRDTMEEEHVVSQFFSDIISMIQSDLLIPDTDIFAREGEICLWYGEAYAKWRAYRKFSGQQFIGTTVLRSYLQKEPFFVTVTQRKVPSLGKNQRVLVLNKKILAEEHSDFVTYISEKVENQEY